MPRKKSPGDGTAAPQKATKRPRKTTAARAASKRAERSESLPLKDAPIPDAFRPLLAFTADVHIDNHGQFGGPMVDGINRRGRECLDTFGRAIVAAARRGVECFVVAGDLTHRSNPGPKITAEIQSILGNPELAHMAMLLVPGNHEMCDARAAGGNTALAPLASLATVPGEPRWYNIALDEGGAPAVQVLAIPFDATERMDLYLADRLTYAVDLPGYDPAHKGPRILVTHVGVFDTNDATGSLAWLSVARDGISAQDLTGALVEAGISQAFVGNFHEPRRWELVPGHTIIQAGTLIPRSWDWRDQGLDRGWLWYTDGVSVHRERIPGPRFLDVAPSDLGAMPPAPPGHSYYLRQVGGTPPMLDPAEHGWAALQHKPDKVAGAPDPVTDTERKATGSALTPEEAIRRTCAEHPLSSAGWLEAEDFASQAIQTYKDAQK